MRGRGRRYAAATHLLIAQFKRVTLKGSYGVDSMHIQRRCAACFHRRKRDSPRGGRRREECWAELFLTQSIEMRTNNGHTLTF
jgi:hypothetical protein